MLRAIRSRISCRIFLPVFGNYMKKTFHPYKIGMFAVFLFSIMLSGCSSFQSMEKLNIFSSDTPRSCSEKAGVKGRFSIHYQADGKEESLHGGFDWKQAPDYTVITLLSGRLASPWQKLKSPRN